MFQLITIAIVVYGSATHQETSGPELPEDLELLLGDVRLALEAGDSDSAREIYSAIFDEGIYEEVSGLEPRVRLIGLLRLEAAGDRLGSLELLARVQEDKLELVTGLGDDDDTAVLEAKQALATTIGNLGDLERKHDLLVSALEVVRASRPENDPIRLRLEGNMAIARYEMHDFAGSLELLEHVHLVWERELPADHPDLLRAKVNLAAVRSELGDAAGTRELEEEVHAAWTRLLPPDHPDLLWVKANLGSTRYGLGDYEGAYALFEEAHDANERALPASHPYLLQTKRQLASACMKLGRPERAAELYLQILSAAGERHADDDEIVLDARVGLGSAYFLMGRVEDALELFDEVHSIRVEALPPAHPKALNAKRNLAIALNAVGDSGRARDLNEQIHAICVDVLPSGHPRLLLAKRDLAIACIEAGDPAAAHGFLRDTLAIQLQHSTEIYFESPRVARASARKGLKDLHEYLSVAKAAESAGEESLDAALFSLMETLRDASTSDPVALASDVPHIRELRDRVTKSRERLNELVLSVPEDPQDLGAWRAELLAESDVRDSLQREIRRELGKGKELEALNPESIAAGLAVDAVFISFLRYNDHEDGPAGPSVDSLLAYVVTPGGSVRRVDLGGAAEIETLVESWRASLGRPIRGRGSESRGIGESSEESAEEEISTGKRVRERVIDPCLEVLGDMEPSTVHLLLDDFLHLVPIDALPLESGDRLGTALTIRFESSARRIVAPGDGFAGTGSLLAVGAVDFESSSGDRVPELPEARARAGVGAVSGAEHFVPLPGTAEEVDVIAGLYRGRFEGEPMLLKAERASKEALRERAGDARFVHIATHGWFAAETIPSTFDSATGEPDDLLRANEAVRGFAPETLCGLALAGANRSGARSDAVMTAEELATLDFSNCELAVLSACETNVGIRRAGQGIQSLQSALRAAGARTAITSLWRVDDDATRLLMELFYAKLWKEGSGKADALWEAKMALEDAGLPVRDWAGWVLTGDPD